jgi:hypothetical protein
MPVMALGEDGDAVHVRALHRARKLLRIEFDTHIANPWAGVKIKMNLAIAQRWRRQKILRIAAGGL